MRQLFFALFAALISAFPAIACDGRLVDDAAILKGPVCVPEKPQRIVVIDPTFSLGMALELDLPVVGAPLSGMSDAALKAEAVKRGVTDLGGFAEPSIETVIALRPDLIIGSGIAGEAVLKIASQIAPTVLINAENWKHYYRIVGDVSGNGDRVAAALDGYETRAAALRARIPDIRVSVLRITPWDFQVYLDSPDAYGPFLVLKDAGVKRSAYETSAERIALKRPDLEELAALDGDVLLYIVGGANDSDVSGRHEQVIGNPLWKMLPAVRAGRVHRVDAGTWMEFSGIGSANRVLDDIERYIVGAR